MAVVEREIDAVKQRGAFAESGGLNTPIRTPGRVLAVADDPSWSTARKYWPSVL